MHYKSNYKPYRVLLISLLVLLSVSITNVSADFSINTSGYEDLTSHEVMLTSTPITAAMTNATNGDVLNIAAGTYFEYAIPLSASVTFSGSGRTATIIDGLQGRVFASTSDTRDITIRDLTVMNGSAGEAGHGGAIRMSGSGSILTIDSCIFSGNSAGGNPSGPGGCGGAIYIQNGDFTISGSTFTENSAGDSSSDSGGCGGAIYVRNGDLTISDSTFTENSAGDGSLDLGRFGGGAIYVWNGDFTISGSTFTENSAGDNSVGSGGFGGAIYYELESGTGSITRSTFLNNMMGSGGATGEGGFLYGGAGDAGSVQTSVNFNRIFGNSRSTSGGWGSTVYLDSMGTHTVDSTLNWWGNNTDPKDWGGVVNDSGTTVETDPYLVLGVSASPSSISPSGTSTITADLIHTNHGTDVSSQGTVPDGIPVTLGATLGTLSSTLLSTVNGEVSTSFTSSGTGTSTISARIDGQTVNTNVVIKSPSGGVSSGGSTIMGSPPAYVNTVTTTGPVPPGGKVKFGIKESAVYEIVLTSCNGAEKIMLTLVWASRPSENVNKTGRPTYEYEDVNLYFIEEDDLCGCLFRFKLPKSWFERLGIDSNDIVMAHWNGEEWEDLPTYLIDDTGSFYYYESYIERFSWFAIVVEEDATDMSKFGGEEVGGATTEQPTRFASSPSATETPQAGTSAQDYTFIPLAIFILVAILAGIVIMGVINRRRESKYPEWWFKEK